MKNNHEGCDHAIGYCIQDLNNKGDNMKEKTLDSVNTADTQKKVSDVQIIGDTDTFQLICKASSKEQGWMKSTKAMEIEGCGVVVQVSTQQGNNVAESVCFVPDAEIVTLGDGSKKITGV